MKLLEKAKDIKVIFVWSGQHYSDNLKGVFFREFKLKDADYELGCRGATDVEIAGELIKKLYVLLDKIKPDAVAFLGDTNTTAGCLAPAMLNIPIIHIEGCWHSYDWRMPEEKYRTISDDLADVIYTYEEEYKQKGVAQGLNPKNIVVTGGEPLMHNLDGLCRLLKQDGFNTWIETSGSYLLTGKWDWICVSPKKFKAPLKEVLQQAHELKLIVFNKSINQ